jgi:uncharacterized protein
MDKLSRLKNILRRLRSVVVAYSGGLDSTFLLKTAIDALGRRNVIAVTARSETYPLREYREAVKIARKMGARHLTMHTNELKIKSFSRNPVNRCYYCKRELFKALNDIRKRHGFASVLDGTNYDDLKDIRHGRKAAAERGIRSPLLEAKITKTDIRRFSKALKLSTWDKPSFACLASRIPFNDTITKKKLDRIERAEEFLKGLGFKQVRVRLHGDIARLEFYRTDFRLLTPKTIDKITAKLKPFGFKYICLDLEGYRTGNMHGVSVLTK